VIIRIGYHLKICTIGYDHKSIKTGVLLWASHDPVQLVPEAYQELADVVLEDDHDEGSDAGSPLSATTTSSGSKRKNAESVITTPLVPITKCGRVSHGVKPAGWLVRRTDSAASSLGCGQWRGEGLSDRWQGGHPC
jgi:hypothetical protein